MDVVPVFDQLENGLLGDWVGTNEYVIIGFADGEVWRLNAKTPLSTLRQFLNVELAKVSNRKKELDTWRLNEK